MNFNKSYLLSRLELHKVVLANGCWIFKGPNTESKREIYVEHQNYLVSRISMYIFSNFNLDSPKLICHECRTKNCWNPKHLYIGDSSTNALDSIRDGTFKNQNSDKTHCKYGHLLSGSNLYLHTSLDGSIHRWCKICRNKAAERYRNKKRSES